MKEQNNKKQGSTIDKAEDDLFQNILLKLEPDIGKLVTEMEKINILKGKQAG
jgi:hypothetical protein